MSSARVNRPTDSKAKEADVNRKLQFYGIATAFQNGKVPSNEQIDIALNSVLASKALSSPPKQLSTEGKALIKDVRDVVEQAKVLLLSKNEGDLLQDFIWQAQQIDSAEAGLPGTPVDKETAKAHGNQALDGLRTLGTLLVTNGQFRKLLSDATILARDIAGDAATKAASKINPSDEQLSQIDKPAEDNVWHDKPNVSAGDLKQQLKGALKDNAPIDKDDLRDAAGDASQAAHPSGSRDPAETAELAAKDQKEGGNSGVDASSGARAGLQTLKDRVDQGTDEETKDLARAHKQKTKNYLSKKMPEERRDQTIWRLRKMVTEIQGHPDYQEAINTLLSLAEQYAGHANTIGQQATGSVKGAHEDSSLQRAEKDLKTLIERFANGTSTNDLFDAINQIYRDADQDPELKSWFKNVDAYIRKALKQQGYIMEDAATDEWNALYDRGEFLLRDRYRNHTDRILDELKFLGDQFDKDPLNKKLGDSLTKLFNDLGNDENGKATFKPHLVKDLTDVIIPAIFTSIQYVPIPRIEYSDPTIDVIVENLIIESDNLMPNILEVANDNYWRWGRKNLANSNRNSIMLSVSGVQMDLRDVAYYVKRKEGSPKITDKGVLDVFLGGSGLSFKIKLSTADKTDRQNFFKVDKVDVDVKNFNIKIKQSKHKLLFGMAKPVMLKLIRPALQKVAEKQIKDQIHRLDSFLWRVKQEADRAQRELAENPEEAQNIYQRYVNAAQKQFMQGKKKAEEAKKSVEDKHVNVAVTKQDSMFPDIHLPGGISSKATEYKKQALEGEEWRSPVFKLGSASTSTTIPSAPEVTRKEHEVTQGGVRGPQNIGGTTAISSQLHEPASQQATATANSTTAATTNGSAVTGSAGFSSQVDNAFNTGLKTNGTNGTNGNTTLGASNPVLTGQF